MLPLQGNRLSKGKATNLSRIVRTLSEGSVIAFGVFTVLWTLLSPLGGFTAVDKTFSKTSLTYTGLVLASLAIAALVTLYRIIAKEPQSTMRFLGDSRMELNVADQLASAKRRVLVLGLSIPSYASEQALRTYDNLLSREVEINLVLVNPFSPSLLQRPNRLYLSRTPLIEATALSLRTLVNYTAKLPPLLSGRFHVYVLNMLPSVGVVLIDDACLWHPYLEDSTGLSSPYMVEPTNSGYGVHILRYAESLCRQPAALPATLDPDVLIGYLKGDTDISFHLTQIQLRAIRRILGP